MNMRLSVIVLCAFYLLGTASAAANRRARMTRSDSRPIPEPVADDEYSADVPAAAGAGLSGNPFSAVSSMISGGLGAVGTQASGAVRSLSNGVAGTVRPLANGPVSSIGSGVVDTVGSLAGGAANTIDSIGTATGIGAPVSSMTAAGTAAYMNYGPLTILKQSLVQMIIEIAQTIKQFVRETVQNMILRIPSNVLQLILSVISQVRLSLETTFRRVTGIGNGANL
uniref:Uncharacterized protein n=1 Tax=Cacopsylla melanoneura TaxID=428564 RepID=A0A8D8QTR8_9HEMI